MLFSGFQNYRLAIDGKTPLVIANVVKTVKTATNSFMIMSFGLLY